ncbi:MAG: hypothetical protein ACRYHQ_04470, partial [Janthinobacterium lividum]
MDTNVTQGGASGQGGAGGRQRGAAAAMLDPAILLPAIGDTLRKLDPRSMIRNPVMFVVEVVAALTTVLFLRDLATGG